MVVVLVAYWMASVDSTITNLGFGTLAGGLNVTIDEVAWVSSSYVLAMMTALPLSGWLAAYFGRKRAFLLALGLFTAASFACAISGSLAALVIARFVQGLGAGAMQPLVSATLMDSYPEDQLAKAFKVLGLGGMVGPLTGPLIGGWVLDNFAWPAMFLVNVPIGLLTLALGVSVLRDQTDRPAKTRFDWGALTVMTAALVAFQYVVQQGQRDDWFSSGNIVLAAIVTVVAFTIFVRSQLRSATPLVNLQPLKIPSYTAGTVLAIVTGIGFTGTAFIVPLYFMQVLGFDATTAGLGVLPAAIATIVAIQFSSSRWAKHVSPVLLALLGLVAFAVGTMWFVMLGKNAGFGEIILPRVLQGLGNGLTYVPLNVLVMRGIPRKWYDGASGLTGLMRQLGVTFGYAVLSGFLVRAQTSAQSELTARVHLSTLGNSVGFEPIRQFLMGRGFTPDQANAYAGGVFGQLVSREAALWGYNETFWVIGLLFIATLPVIAMFWRTAAAGGER